AVLLVFVIFILSFSNRSFGQNVSNEGTDFWTVFPSHEPTNDQPVNLAKLKVFITSKYDTEVTVTCGSWSSGLIAIPANTSVGILVDRPSAYVNLSDANTLLTNRGIHIVVPDGKPKVSAYSHIYAGARSAATLILPFETLGQNYYSVNYDQTSNLGNNYLAIVAVEDNTSIIIHEKSGASIKKTLLKTGDVFEYVSGKNDLTGVFVETDKDISSCKRFAAFSGTSNTGIGDCTRVSGTDPLYQQLYPVSSLGKSYGVMPFHNQSYLYRAIAVDDNTKIYQDGNLVATLNKGNYYTSGRLVNGAYVTGDKNFILSQYMYSSSCASISGSQVNYGDPDMVVLNSIEFNISGITVFSSDLEKIYEKYINVLIRSSKTSSFKINGVAPSVTWNVLPGNAVYSYAQIPVTNSSLTLTADEGFNAIAYGYGQTESYAYSAGTNLASNNYLTVVNDVSKEEYQNGCINTEMSFKINLPYKPDKITWNLDSEAQIETTNEPEIKVINGQTFYIYSYPGKKTYSATGDHTLKVIAHVPNNAANCQSGDFETNYIFSIYNLPTADFTLVPNSCAKSDITFTDKSLSSSADFSITSWLWDFGDGNTSTDQNPKHQYAVEGTYTVSLIAKAGSGCYSDAVTKTVKIYPLPVSKFAASLNTCINTDYVVTDQSDISQLQSLGKIVKWSWDFGDGTKLDKSDKTPFAHQYTSTGTYTVSLITTSDQGCISLAFTQNVKVSELPVADFTMPDVCLSDPFALFVDKSVDASGGSGTFTYEWDFGDSDSTPANPNKSTARDGKHQYRKAGVYNVTLKIINVNGCVTTKTLAFTVNGGVQKAGFTVQNESNLCSNQAVIINNTSVAAFGKITRIDIYKDYINASSSFETIPYPTSDDIQLKYLPFGGSANKNVTIRLVAYSGETCNMDYSKTIMLKPSPILEFADIPAACQNDGSVIINQAKETSGIAGSGIYSGDGVDAAGNFNPKSVNAGLHLITYTFTAANGCPTVISKAINVYKSPTADAGATLFILAGGQVTIPAVADGLGLTYKWAPSVGLDHDNILNPIASPEKDTDYKLIATTAEGCTVTTSVTVKVLQGLVPPNSFTPNGDGVNDVWNIKYLESYPNATIEVFNRNGNRVFFSNGYKTPFDGNYQNEPLPVGVYYYLINPRNGRKTVTGPLTIIR
ncbi:MAG: PKD domain-containing protein, partial [Flavobacterium sp.]